MAHCAKLERTTSANESAQPDYKATIETLLPYGDLRQQEAEKLAAGRDGVSVNSGRQLKRELRAPRLQKMALEAAIKSLSDTALRAVWSVRCVATGPSKDLCEVHEQIEAFHVPREVIIENLVSDVSLTRRLRKGLEIIEAVRFPEDDEDA